MQVFGPPAAMYYLELSYMAMGIALGVGCAASALAAWATRSSKDTPPVLHLSISNSATALMSSRAIRCCAEVIKIYARVHSLPLEVMGVLLGCRPGNLAWAFRSVQRSLLHWALSWRPCGLTQLPRSWSACWSTWGCCLASATPCAPVHASLSPCNI